MPTLPALLVKNSVSWINPAFSDLPFSFSLGESSSLGLFFCHAPQTEGVDADADDADAEDSLIRRAHLYELEIEPGHSRSAVIVRMEIRDTSGRVYKIIDAKGVGYIKGPPRIQPRYGATLPLTLGIFDAEDARLDVKMSELFLGYGMNVPRPIAVIDLHEIVGSDGKPMSVETAKEQGIVLEDLNPVIEIRAFTTRTRLQDVINGRRKDYEGMYTNEELARNLGRNVGIMHSHGWKHGVMTPHNIALDGSIMDFDFAMESNDVREDLREIEKTLHLFFESSAFTPIFYDAYKNV